jgi:hypothetical protein
VKGVSQKRSVVDSSGSASSTTRNGREIQKKTTGQLANKDKVSTHKNSVAITSANDNVSSAQYQIPVGDTLDKKGYQSTDTIKNNKEQKKRESLPQNKLASESKPDSSKSLKFSFAAGLSLHQQLPINGQKFVPYNLEGRKGTIADYIPSVYVRMYQRKKWFLQSEFRYGAPQYTKEFLYRQEVDTNLFITTTKSIRLKKTYYNQLPLTFHYYVSKNLSLGSGIMWNKFVGAISSQDVVQHNNITGLDSSSEGTILVSKKNDTGNVFVESWFQAVFEAEYKWKKFSLGARYTIGLQPYIKFELPGAAPQEEKNSALDIFIRYELWRSRKK